ncbi:HAMP domain-containing protein [Desulfovibrio sp. PG-178-WT-4]|uniref:HAMP domain-containing protein n=3 Tax=Desulfovibrio TaxID=872 RepID=A0A6L5XIV8_9BACT|nr:methyl-accepting chemotaxis protein [Desulfovibrio porci]MDY3809340.1 methyl-accepting chemotaxis protein [Desulfovibrio porci]MSS27064.1 HAMP domain-containing protein [Desulfovibrio porci]
MRWKDIRLVYKLGIAFGGIVLLFGLYACYNFNIIENIAGVSDDLDRSSESELTLLKAENAHFIWAGEVAAYILDDTVTKLNVVTDGRQCAFGKWFYSDGRRELEQRLPAVAPILDALEKPHLGLHASVPGIIEAHEQGDAAATQRRYREGIAKNLVLIREGLGKAIKLVDEDLARSNATLDNTLVQSRRVALLMSGGILLVCVLLAVFLTRSIAGPLRALVLYAQEVAGGNLREPRIIQKDEVGQLNAALGVMVGTLKHKIEEAREQTDMAMAKSREAEAALTSAEEAARESAAKNELILEACQRIEDVVSNANRASGELSTGIIQSKQGAEVQARKISETASAMEQMSSVVIEVSRNASSAAELSADARQKAEEGADVVLDVTRSIRSVQEQSRQLKEDMQTLGQHAQAVNRIMGVISDIADQTNLLALNAAIEAARAGESGRGFAVVADEVRKLAEKTMASTTDVDNAVRAIQQSADKNMRQVDETVQTIEQATELTGRSGEALREIVAIVDGAATQVRAIATASEEQAASSREMADAINEVDSVAGQTAQAMNNAARSVADLAAQTRTLHSLVMEMRGRE